MLNRLHRRSRQHPAGTDAGTQVGTDAGTEAALGAVDTTGAAGAVDVVAAASGADDVTPGPGSKHLGALAVRAAVRGSTLLFETQAYEGLELFERSAGLAGGLAAAGIGPGDRVVVLMANCPEVSIAYTAIWRAGAVATPVVFLVTAPELAHILVDSGAAGVITTAELAGRVAQTGVTLPTWVVGEDSYAALEAHAPLDLVDRADDDLAALLYTGGTTGRSKGVMLTHANLWASGYAGQQRALENSPVLTRSITALPLSHAYGMLVTVAGLFAEERGLMVLQRWFDPAAFLALTAEHRIQIMAVVPSMLQLMLAQPLEDLDLSSLQSVASGASPLAPAVIEEWERRVPSSVVLEGYGLTESSALVSSSTRAHRRIGAVGLPVPGVSVRIVKAVDITDQVDPVDPGHPDDAVTRDHQVPAGVDGEITVLSAGVTPGYWQAEEQTRTAIRDGWLHTGDVGHLDADGYLYVVDRIKDLIIRGGFNVYPRDIEDVLLAHPAVAGAAVVGRPDAVHGEEVVAFVALRPGVTETEEGLRAYAKDRVSAAKYPREVHIVDAIPLTSVGKTDRKALRAQLRGPTVP